MAWVSFEQKEKSFAYRVCRIECTIFSIQTDKVRVARFIVKVGFESTWSGVQGQEDVVEVNKPSRIHGYRGILKRE